MLTRGDLDMVTVGTAVAVIALTDRGLLVPTGRHTYVTARLGQWLTHDLATGEFTVTDDDVFRLVHRASHQPARLDAVKEAR